MELYPKHIKRHSLFLCPCCHKDTLIDCDTDWSANPKMEKIMASMQYSVDCITCGINRNFASIDDRFKWLMEFSNMPKP